MHTIPRPIIACRGPGRPPISRQALLDAVTPRRPNATRVLVRRSVVARVVGCSPRTVGRMVADLERQGELRRIRRAGRRGLLIEPVRRHVTVHPPTVVLGEIDLTRFTEPDGPGQ